LTLEEGDDINLWGTIVRIVPHNGSHILAIALDLPSGLTCPVRHLLLIESEDD
jgi:hypothetical protein